jgi:transglutaminase-like putative cysteine protease
MLSAAVGAYSMQTAHPAVSEERVFNVTYEFTLRDLPEDAGSIKAWSPLPLSNEWQTLESFSVEQDWPHEIVDEKEYGNRFILFDLSGHNSEAGQDPKITLRFRIRRRAYDALATAGQNDSSISRHSLQRFLAPDSLIPIGGKIYEEARRVAGRAEDPILRARLLYDHIVNSLVYDKTGSGWGRGDALYACNARAGNCTDFHSLFIGEARALGLPSRFIMGLAIPDKASEGSIAGYHCWAEFYVDGRGWIPVDASEAHKDPSRIEELFGGLDANRVAFTIGRDIDIPGSAGGLHNYIIYPHVDVEGRTHADIETKFSFAEVSG